MAPLPTNKRKIHSSLSRSKGASSNALINMCIAIFAILFLVCLILYISALNAAFQEYKPQVKERPQVRTVVQNNKVPENKKKEPNTNNRFVQQNKLPEKKAPTNNRFVQQNKNVVGEHLGRYTGKATLVLTTDVGKIRIVLRPDLSKESVEYIHKMAAGKKCNRCQFYRSEKPSILQGVMAVHNIEVTTVKGSCPKGYENVKNDCPAWDKECACHGPVMEHGMVGWAAGKTGPDFFINASKRKATWWGTQHTVWGRIEDAASFKVLDHIWTLPVEKQGSLSMLKQTIHFTMEIV